MVLLSASAETASGRSGLDRNRPSRWRRGFMICATGGVEAVFVFHAVGGAPQANKRNDCSAYDREGRDR